MGRFIDLTGQRFGRYTVISRAANKNGETMWNCVCDCGTRKTVHANSLRSGHVVSCGCYKKEERRNALTTHGGTVGGKPSRLYKIWDGMKARCYNQNKTYYPIYGGRGIGMCDEWHYSFEAFRDWSLANGYADDLTIDRIDVNGNYEPSNCRWATVSEQNNNKTTSHFLTYNGEKKTLMQWSEATGFSFYALLSRLKKGMSVEETLLTPLRKRVNGHNEYVPSKLISNKTERNDSV